MPLSMSESTVSTSGLLQFLATLIPRSPRREERPGERCFALDSRGSAKLHISPRFLGDEKMYFGGPFGQHRVSCHQSQWEPSRQRWYVAPPHDRHVLSLIAFRTRRRRQRGAPCLESRHWRTPSDHILSVQRCYQRRRLGSSARFLRRVLRLWVCRRLFASLPSSGRQRMCRSSVFSLVPTSSMI